MKVWSRTKQEDVDPKDLPLKDLIYILDHIGIDVSDCWMPETEKKEGYAAIDEAIRRLKESERKGVRP